MSKIQILKTEYLGEIPLFPAGIIFPNFKKKYGKSFAQAFKEDDNDLEALAFILFTANQSACKILGKESVLSEDDLLNAASIQELMKGFQLLYPENQEEPKKK